jgi:acyltransferase
MGVQSTPHRAGERRNTGIDLFRGVLVVLVILGHFAELTDRHNFLTWFGFGFRMPLFIGLTGYLFNLEQARSLSLGALYRKYYGRLILPWLAACAVTLTIAGTVTWLTPLAILVRPPYHLWFVPVMLAFIFAARLCRLTPTMMLAITIPVSITAMYLFGVDHEIRQFEDWVPDRRYFIYPIYFAFGMWIARRPFDPTLRLPALLTAAVGLIWWCRLYSHPSAAGEVAASLILCLPLIGLFPWIKGANATLSLLVHVGQDSLFFYLWHPLAFALWAAWGVTGLPLLVLCLTTMLLSWVAVSRFPAISAVLGAGRARSPRIVPPRLPDAAAPSGIA